jgi:hypothetical protein
MPDELHIYIVLYKEDHTQAKTTGSLNFHYWLWSGHSCGKWYRFASTSLMHLIVKYLATEAP